MHWDESSFSSRFFILFIKKFRKISVLERTIRTLCDYTLEAAAIRPKFETLRMQLSNGERKARLPEATDRRPDPVSENNQSSSETDGARRVYVEITGACRSQRQITQAAR